MKTLTAFFFTASLCSAAVSANDLSAQLHADAQAQLSELRQANQHNARLAMNKTVIEVAARQAAEQGAADSLLAFQPAEPSVAAAE